MIKIEDNIVRTHKQTDSALHVVMVSSVIQLTSHVASMEGGGG